MKSPVQAPLTLDGASMSIWVNWNPENNRIIITRVDLGALILINWLNNNLKRFNPVSISNGIESDEKEFARDLMLLLQ